MLDETCWITRTNDINFHVTFLQHLSNISSNMLDKMLDRFNEALRLCSAFSKEVIIEHLIILTIITKTGNDHKRTQTTNEHKQSQTTNKRPQTTSMRPHTTIDLSRIPIIQFFL